MQDRALRQHLHDLLTWEDAHVRLDEAVDGVPPDLYGRRPERLPYSLWQLLEHMRITQWDILEFCRNPQHRSPEWPEGYWPEEAAPPSESAWAESIARFREDRQALLDLVTNPQIDLFLTIPHGEGQTFLREALLVADHTAYHTGQFVAVRRQLGIWPPEEGVRTENT